MPEQFTAKEIIAQTQTTADAIYDDLTDIGKTVDYSKMSLEQLSLEFTKFRKEQDNFKWEIRKLIEIEITKQVKPLADNLERLVNKKIVYVKPATFFIDILSRIYGKIMKK